MTAPNPKHVATLLVSCPDRRGLVASLAQVLAGHGANILSASQHNDLEVGMFFQRIRFDASELITDRGTLERALAEVGERFKMELSLFWDDQRKRVAVLVSRYDHCLVDLLYRHRAGEIEADVRCIVSNHPDLAPVAQHFQLPFHHLPVSAANKAAAEAQLLELLAREGVDLVVLARYMQVLSGEFLRAFEKPVINIHHSFLPAFVGGSPYRQAYERGVKLIGATAHYATEELDQGPIIEQDVTRSTHRDSVEDLVRRGRDLEKLVLARAVRWHVQNRVLVTGRRTVVFD